MNDTNVTITGFVAKDPELKTTGNGLTVVNLSIGSTPSKFDKQSNEWVSGTTLWMRATAWRQFAEQIANNIRKGNKVIAYGKMVMEDYTDKDGNNRQSLRMDLESLGLDLSYAPKNDYSAIVRNTEMDEPYSFAKAIDEDSPF